MRTQTCKFTSSQKKEGKKKIDHEELAAMQGKAKSPLSLLRPKAAVWWLESAVPNYPMALPSSARISE